MEGTSNSSISSNGGIIVSKQRMKMENPFTLKVGQVFTGFGVGCGLGIGVGRPLNLGAIPMLNQVMVATRGASDVFSGVGRHVNQHLRKFGAKNIEAGIGCGIGFGHGFGVGFAVKPGPLHQAQSFLVQSVMKIMTKFGVAPDISSVRGMLPASLQSGMTKLNDPTNPNPIGKITDLAKKVPEIKSQGLSQDANSQTVLAYEKFTSKSPPLNTPYGSRTEKVLNSFLQSPLLEGEDRASDDLLRDSGERLRSENNVLQLVLKHQQIIEELMEENMKLRDILVEDLKIPPSKLQASSKSSKITSPCAECFECRRKQRKNR